MCPTESAAYRILGFRLKADLFFPDCIVGGVLGGAGGIDEDGFEDAALFEEEDFAEVGGFPATEA